MFGISTNLGHATPLHEVTKNCQLYFRFQSMLKTAYVDRFLRSAFTKSSSPDPKTFYKFSLYSPNDLTCIINQSMEPDELLDYAVNNRIDVVISINQLNSGFSIDTDKIQITQTIETKANKFTSMTIKDISYTTNRIGSHTYKLRHAVLNDLQLKQVSVPNSLPGTVEYTKESIDTLTWVIMKVLNGPVYRPKRVVLAVDSKKTSSIMLMSLINFFTAKQENSINVNQAGQTVLCKLPIENSQFLPSLKSSDYEYIDYESFYKSIFSIVSTFFKLTHTEILLKYTFLGRL